MIEQGAARRQRAPRGQACADCAGLSASGAPGGAAPWPEGRVPSQGAQWGLASSA